MDQDKDIDQAAQKFLENDFNQCFTQMRHYDSQILDVTKFSFAAYSVLIGAAFALYKFSAIEAKGKVDLVPVALALLAVGLTMGLFMLGLVVRNRVYFVYVARYVNEHRRFFSNAKPLGFPNHTRMYTSLTQHPFFNWRSSQAVQIYLLSAMNAVLLFVLTLIGLIQCCPDRAPWVALATMGVLFFVQAATSALYLKSRDNKFADAGVFGKDTESSVRRS